MCIYNTVNIKSCIDDFTDPISPTDKKKCYTYSFLLRKGHFPTSIDEI